MSNIPSRTTLARSTPNLQDTYLPRDYRVTGTVPQPAPRTAVPRKAEAGLPGLTAAQSFWLLLIIHGGLIAGEIYLAWKANWI